MGYKMRLKKYMCNENEKNNPNPYQEMYQDSDEIFNFLVEVRHWKKNRLVEEYFILKELEDLENLKKELNE